MGKKKSAPRDWGQSGPPPGPRNPLIDAKYLFSRGRLGQWKGIIFLLIPAFTLISFSCAQAQTPLNLPDPPLRLLAESAAESCSICARQLREQAYDLLDREFPLERILATTDSCLLLRSPEGEENELVLSCDPPVQGALPLLLFRFHTPANHLAGISPGDFTADDPAAEYSAAAPGTAFEAILKIIPFRYGNRPSFLYSLTRKAIQVHCRLITLRRK